MTRLLRLIFIHCILLLTLVSCGTPQSCHIGNSSLHSVDTVWITRTESVHDTIIFSPLPQEAQRIVTRDTTSHLETSVSYSDASIQDGFLYHTLINKPDSVQFRIQYKDRVIVNTETEYQEIPVEVIKEVPVEKIVKKVPPWCWYLLTFDIVVFLLFAVVIYLKIRGT